MRVTRAFNRYMLFTRYALCTVTCYLPLHEFSFMRFLHYSLFTGTLYFPVTHFFSVTRRLPFHGSRRFAVMRHGSVTRYFRFTVTRHYRCMLFFRYMLYVVHGYMPFTVARSLPLHAVYRYWYFFGYTFLVALVCDR